MCIVSTLHQHLKSQHIEPHITYIKNDYLKIKLKHRHNKDVIGNVIVAHGDYIELKNLHVKERYRKLGVASKLIDAVKIYAKKHRKEHIQVNPYAPKKLKTASGCIKGYKNALTLHDLQAFYVRRGFYQYKDGYFYYDL